LFDRSFDGKQRDHGLPLHLQLLMLRPETPYLSNAPTAHNEQVMASFRGQDQVENTGNGRYDDVQSARDMATSSFCVRRNRSTHLSTAEGRRVNDDYTLETRWKTYTSYMSLSLSGHRLLVSLQITIAPPGTQFLAEITSICRALPLAGTHARPRKCSQGAARRCKHTTTQHRRSVKWSFKTQRKTNLSLIRRAGFAVECSRRGGKWGRTTRKSQQTERLLNVGTEAENLMR
jgi:hypothetical protein